MVQNYWFAKADKVLLAVSGGKNSVLMAQLFKQAGYNFLNIKSKALNL
jgi:tRNA(Ile)-lysidine synthase